jgi:hypothetical protein
VETQIAGLRMRLMGIAIRLMTDGTRPDELEERLCGLAIEKAQREHVRHILRQVRERFRCRTAPHRIRAVGTKLASYDFQQHVDGFDGPLCVLFQNANQILRARSCRFIRALIGVPTRPGGEANQPGARQRYSQPDQAEQSSLCPGDRTRVPIRRHGSCGTGLFVG